MLLRRRAVLFVFLLNFGRASYGANYPAFNQEIAPNRVGLLAGVMGAIGAFSGAILVWLIGLISKSAGFRIPFLSSEAWPWRACCRCFWRAGMITNMHKAALIKGDGIGPEMCEATQRAIAAAGVAIDWRDAPMGIDGVRLLGAPIPLESLETIRHCGVALKGPMIADRCSGGVSVVENGEVRRHPSINNGIRRELGAYANLRPVRG